VGVNTPSATGVRPSLGAWVGDCWKVLAVRDPSGSETERSSREHVERVVTGVHDTGNGNERSGEIRDQDKNRLPDFTSVVHDVQLSGEKQRQKSKTGKRSCSPSV